MLHLSCIISIIVIIVNIITTIINIIILISLINDYCNLKKLRNTRILACYVIQ